MVSIDRFHVEQILALAEEISNIVSYFIFFFSPNNELANLMWRWGIGEIHCGLDVSRAWIPMEVSHKQ